MSTPPKPSKPYSEAYLPEVVEMQGKFFERLQDEPTPIDSSDMIAAYLNSDTRRQLDEGHAYYLTLNADDLKRVFLEESHYEPKSGEPLRGFLPNWIGQFYAYAQWKLGVSSRELVRRIPVRALCVAYPGLHDLALPLAVDKMTNSLPDPRSLIPDPRSLIPDPSSRKGSALLVVLGMLSFMIMSAVAFSVYMRQQRLPSSYLTQQTSASMIVKAALAEAMHEIDHAIGDDPYPNDYDVNGTGWRLGDPQIRTMDKTDEKACCPGKGFCNAWRNRVYFGCDDTGGYAAATTDEGVDPEKTVATMPLEGLAYLPPSLINTVRWWMRRSPSACWKRMAYDAGRYSFTAVNVSDYLDINRLRAGVMRDSTPQNRITLSYRFENDNHTGWGTVSPAAFDTAISNVCGQANYGRFVSLADYNLAVAKSGQFENTGAKSAFCDFIDRRDSNRKPFYGNLDETMLRQQTFVTDTWHPATNAATQLYLTRANGQPDDDGQPFLGVEEGLYEMMKKGTSTAYNKISDRLDIVSKAALYDYLDEDRIPMTLAAPTIERAPMVTGLRIKTMDPFEIKLAAEPDKNGPVPEDNGLKRRTSYAWKIDSFSDASLMVYGSVVYPFKRSSGRTDLPSDYKVQVLVKVFLSTEKLERTRVGNGAAIYKPGTASWAAEQAMHDKGKAYQLLVGETTCDVNPAPLTANDTVAKIEPTIIEIKADALKNKHIYGMAKIELRDENESSGWRKERDPNDKSMMTDPMPYRTADGVKDLKEAPGVDLYLNVLCWVRVMDGDKTVDLVPATLFDDKVYNGFDSGDMDSISELAYICGDEEPIIPVASSEPVLKLSDENLFWAVIKNDASTVPAVTAPAALDLAIYCDDPRYNYAPENWYLSPSGEAKPEEWRTAAQARCDGSDHRPNDIFQFVSDAGYLQSMGEMQFLPYLGDFSEDSTKYFNSESEIFRPGRYKGGPFAERKSPTALADQNLAWKTHWCFGDFADWRDNLAYDPYRWGISDTPGGAAVNPYAAPELFLAGLANTPYDWSVAFGVDHGSGEKGANGSASDLDEDIKLCFNARSTEAKLEWEKLKEIGKRMQELYRSGEPWEKWEDWDADGLFGQTVANFDDVDRKFLFSYWKNCIANDQQLFLLFVRAEPLMMMGGGDQNHTPAQLGARAVALVWRDPARHPQASASSGNGVVPVDQPSHKMRVLFYHQFD